MYDEDLSNLDEWIRRLKVEYDIFFNGNRKKPPDDLRLRVEKLVKRLSEATDMSSSQRFRYTTLISKFYVHRDLWRRTQQDRESSEGYANGLPRAQQELDLPQPPSVREVQVSISAPEREGEKVYRLYEELLRLKGSDTKESATLSFERFADYVAEHTRSIQRKYHCATVIFRIALEDNAIKFTARADNSPSG
ncbi:MAG: hypothetical protein H6Q05_2995 [Acidobacteria bacterium]|nr:hypothetical protein [Acidobacteriota bacterium]